MLSLAEKEEEAAKKYREEAAREHQNTEKERMGFAISTAKRVIARMQMKAVSSGFKKWRIVTMDLAQEAKRRQLLEQRRRDSMNFGALTMKRILLTMKQRKTATAFSIWRRKVEILRWNERQKHERDKQQEISKEKELQETKFREEYAKELERMKRQREDENNELAASKEEALRALGEEFRRKQTQEIEGLKNSSNAELETLRKELEKQSQRAKTLEEEAARERHRHHEDPSSEVGERQAG